MYQFIQTQIDGKYGSFSAKGIKYTIEIWSQYSIYPSDIPLINTKNNQRVLRLCRKRNKWDKIRDAESFFFREASFLIKVLVIHFYTRTETGTKHY